MTEAGTTPADEAKRGFVITVGTTEHTVPTATVTFDQIVDFEYPGGSADPTYIFKVDYHDALHKPHTGDLVEGGQVEVRHQGTEFSVFRSLRS
jgi:hypothetical protein